MTENWAAIARRITCRPAGDGGQADHCSLGHVHAGERPLRRRHGNPPHMGSSAQQIIMKIIAERAQPVARSCPQLGAAERGSGGRKALEKLPADGSTRRRSRRGPRERVVHDGHDGLHVARRHSGTPRGRHHRGGPRRINAHCVGRRRLGLVAVVTAPLPHRVPHHADRARDPSSYGRPCRPTAVPSCSRRERQLWIKTADRADAEAADRDHRRAGARVLAGWGVGRLHRGRPTAESAACRRVGRDPRGFGHH